MINFFILTVLAIPFMPSGATVPRWAYLSLVCAVLFFRINLSWPFLIFVGYLLLMSWIAPVSFEAINIFWHFLLFAILFCWAQGADLKRIAIGAGAAIWVNSAVVIAQYYGWQGIPQLVLYSGLFYNKNMGAEAAGMILALVVAYRVWWLIPGILPTLYFGSRAPLLALGVATGCALWRWSRFAALLTTLSVALIVVSLRWEGGQQMFISNDLIQRIGVWQDMLPHLTIWGHGLGSFIVDYPAFQAHTQPLALRFENAHNDFLQTVYELGLGGILLIAILLARMTAVRHTPAWYAMIVFLVEACFGFPLFEPVSGALAACCAGILFVGCASLRDLLPDRRSRIWARVENHGLAPFRPGVGLFPAFALTSFRLRLRDNHQARPGRDTGSPQGATL